MEGMEPKKSNGALIGAVIIIIILIIGGMWLSSNQDYQNDLMELGIDENQVITPEEVEILEEVAEDQTPLSEGTDEASLEGDLEGTSFDEFDQDFAELEAALE